MIPHDLVINYQNWFFFEIQVLLLEQYIYPKLSFSLTIFTLSYLVVYRDWSQWSWINLFNQMTTNIFILTFHVWFFSYFLILNLAHLFSFFSILLTFVYIFHNYLCSNSDGSSLLALVFNLLPHDSYYFFQFKISNSH